MGRHADDQRSRGVARWVVIGVIVALLLVADDGRLPDRDAQQRQRRFRMSGAGQRCGRRRAGCVAGRRLCRRRIQRRFAGGPLAVREGRGDDGLGPGRARGLDGQDLAGRPRPGPGDVDPRRPRLPGAARHGPAGSLRRPPDRPRRLVAGSPGGPEGRRRGCRVSGLVDVAAIGRVVRVRHAVRRSAPGARAAGCRGESGDRAGRAIRGGGDGRHDQWRSRGPTSPRPRRRSTHCRWDRHRPVPPPPKRWMQWRAGAGTPRPFRSRRSIWWRSTPLTVDRSPPCTRPGRPPRTR